ncbi:MAG: hypothetical protein KBE91_01525 [Bacteroidia bacterium]|nr:hypothetical protein [Bacteroidia bacterium]
MKKLIILAVILTACKKEEVKPQQPVSQPTGTVYCIYQNTFGIKAFLYCAKDFNELNTKTAQYIDANLNPSYEIKNSCNECK